MNYDNTADLAWNYLLETGIATEAELQLVTDINGFSLDTMHNILYSRTGYNYFGQDGNWDEDDEYKFLDGGWHE